MANLCIPGQVALLRQLNVACPDDPAHDPCLASLFQRCCVQYEYRLITAIREALLAATQLPVSRSVDLKIDLLNSGAVDDGSQLFMPFHVAHYGMQHADTATPWTQRSRLCWSLLPNGRAPFVRVQHLMANMGYTLVDESHDPDHIQLRLYYLPRITAPTSTLWHGLDHVPLWFYRVDIDNVDAPMFGSYYARQVCA